MAFGRQGSDKKGHQALRPMLSHQSFDNRIPNGRSIEHSPVAKPCIDQRRDILLRPILHRGEEIPQYQVNKSTRRRLRLPSQKLYTSS